MQVFWEQGYEATSLTELAGAMGITKPSLYAAFGNKEQLFHAALERYTAGPASYVADALAQPTARGVVEVMLRGVARATTLPASPHGCLTVQGALATSKESRPAHDALVCWRTNICRRLEERFRRAADEGDLPHDADPVKLARYVATVASGIAVQAATGFGHEELDEVADTALKALEAAAESMRE